MAQRVDAHVDLTVAMPFLAHQISGVEQYFARKAQAVEAMANFVRQRSSFDDARIVVNAPDSYLGMVVVVMGTTNV